MKLPDQKYAEAVSRNLEYARTNQKRFKSLDDAKYGVGVRAHDSHYDADLKPLVSSKKEEE